MQNTNSNKENFSFGELVAKFTNNYHDKVKKNGRETKYHAKRRKQMTINPSTE